MEACRLADLLSHHMHDSERLLPIKKSVSIGMTGHRIAPY
jgi:hypothetical protein